MEERKPEIPIDIPEPKLFSVIRNFDENGISGKGRVLDGMVFHNGKVVICWRTDAPDSESIHGHSSVTIFDTFKAFKSIHIDSHPDNKTEIIWYEVKMPRAPKKETKKNGQKTRK